VIHVVQRFSWSRTAPYTEADARAYFIEQEQAWLRWQGHEKCRESEYDHQVVLRLRHR
jgi:hypothetical protein